jgi:hypothetical protein
MKRLAGILSTSVIVLGVAACDTGSAGGGDDLNGDDSIEDEITCMADLDITGTFTQSALPPSPDTGCWPIGTWTFQQSIVSNDCSPTPTPASQQFRVDRDTASAEPDFTWIYTYLTDPSANTDLSVTSGGAGLCEGILKIFSDDGKSVWNLHPMLQADLSLIGNGTFEVHTRDQRPPPN